MSNIKVKIIGSQVWTVENLTKEQYIEITGIDIPIVDSIWENDFPKCCIYETFYKQKIKNYLFDFYAAEELHNLLLNSDSWRLPNLNDINNLYKHINQYSNVDNITDDIAESLRGTYGWSNNGTNKIGFNALPNPTKNENGELTESTISSWWMYNEDNIRFDGLRLYNDLSVITFCGSNSKTGFAIRLVMDLQNPRIEDNLEYV